MRSVYGWPASQHSKNTKNWIYSCTTFCRLTSGKTQEPRFPTRRQWKFWWEWNTEKCWDLSRCNPDLFSLALNNVTWSSQVWWKRAFKSLFVALAHCFKWQLYLFQHLWFHTKSMLSKSTYQEVETAHTLSKNRANQHPICVVLVTSTHHPNKRWRSYLTLANKQRIHSHEPPIRQRLEVVCSGVSIMWPIQSQIDLYWPAFVCYSRTISFKKTFVPFHFDVTNYQVAIRVVPRSITLFLTAQ